MTERSVLRLNGERADKKLPIGTVWPLRPASSVAATGCR
jgi:hypothetical protein